MASLVVSPPSPYLSTSRAHLPHHCFPFPSPTRSRSLRLPPPRAKDLDTYWREEGARIIRRSIGTLSGLVDALPQPVKAFPWAIATNHFAGVLFGLASTVCRYLCVPVLAVSSLSEMSYCAHERKAGFIPIPFLLGIAVAWVVRRAAVDVAPEMEEGVVPWYLLASGMFFLLLKLMGSYYPYFGRILVPHFANGGLWTTIWFALLWRRAGAV